MNFITLTGIGDSVWALHKIEAVRDKLAPGDPIDVCLVGGENLIDSRALDFVRRFKFVNSARMVPYGIHKADSWITEDGFYNYIDDGLYEFDGQQYCVLIPNAPLERGIRLEQWLPQYPVRWEIFDDFLITDAEREFANSWGDFAVFYPGPLAGNTEDGHNRGALWRPEDWIDLGAAVSEHLPILVVGASYDASYFEWQLKPLLDGFLPFWTNLIGATNLGQLWAVTSKAKFLVSYQAGVGIVATYLGTPTAIFWRPHGDSLKSDRYLSFDERMASAWVPPYVLESGRHLPLIYGRHGVKYIMEWAERWI